MTVYEVSIPLRVSFRHSLAERNRSRNLFVRVELDSGQVGYGESIPVAYVTGESTDSAVAVIREHYWPVAQGRGFSSYEQVGQWLSAWEPVGAAGAIHTSAKCALELAILDAYGRAFGRRAADLGGLIPLPPPSLDGNRPATYGVALTSDGEWIRRNMARLKWYGLRDFKIKVGLDAAGDRAHVALAAQRLRRRLARGRATLRVDANAAYADPDEATQALAPLVGLGVECVEQPMPRERDGEVGRLARQLGVPVLLDESVRTVAEAAQRLNGEGRVGLNIRLSKNGGFFDSLRMAGLCRERGAPFQLGCHVGETGILAAAQRQLVTLLPDARYIEGAFGTHLLQEDIVRRPVRFGYRGRPPRVGPTGLGADVDEHRLQKFVIRSIQIA